MELLYMKRIAKIIGIKKISQQMLLPNLSGDQSDPTISLQNMQNAQSVTGNIDAIIAAAADVTDSIAALEDAIGAGDTGIKQNVSNKLLEVLAQNDSVKLLMNMNLLPSVESLFNSGDWDRIKIKITTDMAKVQQQQTIQAK